MEMHSYKETVPLKTVHWFTSGVYWIIGATISSNRDATLNSFFKLLCEIKMLFYSCLR